METEQQDVREIPQYRYTSLEDNLGLSSLGNNPLIDDVYGYLDFDFGF